METKRKRAVIYARVSSANDRQDTARQIEDLKRYAVLQDIEIVRIFQEHISGAKKIEERQILAECLEYCTKESVNYLLLSELSRLGRSTLQVSALWRYCMKQKYPFTYKIWGYTHCSQTER